MHNSAAVLGNLGSFVVHRFEKEGGPVDADGGVTCVWRGWSGPTCQWPPTYPTWHTDSYLSQVFPRQYNKNLPIRLTNQEDHKRLPANCPFLRGVLATPTFCPGRDSGLGIIGRPPSNLTQKSTRPLSNKKRTHRFLPDIFLYKDNKGCQYALSGSQPGPSEPRRQKVRRNYIFPGGNLTQACNYKRCRTQ